MKLLLVEFYFFYIFKGSNCAITNKTNSPLLNNLDTAIIVMKKNLKDSLLIFSVILEVNLQVTNDKL